MRFAILLVLGGPLAHADAPASVTVEPAVAVPAIAPSVTVTPHVARVAPASIQGVYAAYRLDVVDGYLLEGGGVRILWGRPDSPFELEFMPSGAWGRDGERGIGRFELAAGLRYVANKHGRVRPSAIGTLAFSSFGHSNDDRVNSLTGAGGLGLELTLRGPCSIALDVRSGPGVDLGGAATAWSTTAMLSIGLYLPDEPPGQGTQAFVPR
jgi:hypothetical protein